MAVSSEEYRNCMAGWASGVTIVTSRAGDRVHGMTVSDFTGVSLSPPLVLVCAEETSVTTGLIAEAGCFAVNVLAQGQEELSNRFASKKDEFRRFEGLACEVGKTGAPFIPGALSHIDCTLVATHPAGDHRIYVGQVEEIRMREGEPLLHCARSYGAFVQNT